MHFKAVIFSLFIASTLAVPAVVPLDARAAPVKYEGSWDYTQTVPPCYPTGPDTEQVHFSVTWDGHYTQSTDEKTGAVTYKGHVNQKGTGVGLTSGKKYQFSSVGNYDQTWTYTPPYDGEYHSVQNYQIVKQGSGVAYSSKYNAYYTYDQTKGLVFRFDHNDDTC
ncbi:hypothetical protein BO99DRAFT_472948 [Aspergillus violaceofuscus CBS 115571]|uniref:Uncharacterized protein n=1 Tax=Aspergillus violaceofuscus (strain CBS 115571) TaxID=1450538 RepID=A0A2V5I8B7_ASPV1|nr:hypothetical protein BO99DRAFT_472948 [Aspergillus violaceofuscus CBS 115571]